MFTGIVEAVGVVETIETRGEVVRLVVDEPRLAAEVALGDSVALNGACLTIAEVGAQKLCFDAIQETLQRTSLGRIESGARVNLERAMRADARFDGHIVQGHVDETGCIRSWQKDGTDVRLFVETSHGFADSLVEKGSVTIDGVSLTVVGVAADGFDVALIPHTLEVTVLGERVLGDTVNLEGDILGKYVKRYIERLGAPVVAGAA